MFSIIEGTSRICFNHKERDYEIIKKERKIEKNEQLWLYVHVNVINAIFISYIVLSLLKAL